MNNLRNIRSISFKPSKFLIALLLGLFLLFALRIEILKAMGSFLIYETDLPKSADAIVILSGSPFDRANKAVLLDKLTSSPIFICTGKNQSGDLKVFKDSVYECELLKMQLMKRGIDENRIQLLIEGTSTAEEAISVLSYAKNNKLDTIIIVSSKFHTRRIHQVFCKKFKKEGIYVAIQGAPSTAYIENLWWKSENGLIALNNEYIKLVYYLFK